MVLKEKRRVIKAGNSWAVSLPRSWLRALNLEPSDVVEVELRRGKIVIRRGGISGVPIKSR